VTGFLLALLASTSWGVSDFIGGVKTRSVPLPLVLAVSQAAGMVVLLVALALHDLAAHHVAPAPGQWLWYAIGAGLASPLALGFLYAAMARGQVAVVSPVAASGAVLPVLVGAARGDHVGTVAYAGIGLALVGALGAAWEPGETPSRGAPRAGGPKAGGLASGGLLAAAAAVATGLYLTLIDAGSRSDPYWVTTIARSTATVTVLAYLAARRGSTASGPRLSGLAIAALAAIGVTDALAEVLFATASTRGALGVVAVLSSLYPVVTAALALGLLRERLRWPQLCAVATALAGVVLLGTAG
jgi:drug/metabolite transporter (DMT)-like permease